MKLTKLTTKFPLRLHLGIGGFEVNPKSCFRYALLLSLGKFLVGAIELNISVYRVKDKARYSMSYLPLMI